MTDLHGARRGAAEEVVPELAAHPAFRHPPLGNVAQRSGERRQRAQRRRQQLVDFCADRLRQYRSSAFGADRHADRRTVDDRRGEEIAEIGAVDSIDRDAKLARVVGDATVEHIVAARRENHDSAGKGGGVIVGFDMRCASFGDPGGEFRRRIDRHDLDRGARLADQPRLGECLVPAADDHHHAPFDP